MIDQSILQFCRFWVVQSLVRIGLTHINDCRTIEVMILELARTAESGSAGGSVQRPLTIHSIPPPFLEEESGLPSSRPEFGRSPVGPTRAVAPRGCSAELGAAPFFSRISVAIMASHRSPP